MFGDKLCTIRVGYIREKYVFRLVKLIDVII